MSPDPLLIRLVYVSRNRIEGPPRAVSEEIRAMKKDAKERGDTEVVKLCEDALQADFDAVVKLIEIRDAGTQM